MFVSQLGLRCQKCKFMCFKHRLRYYSKIELIFGYYSSSCACLFRQIAWKEKGLFDWARLLLKVDTFHRKKEKSELVIFDARTFYSSSYFWRKFRIFSTLSNIGHKEHRKVSWKKQQKRGLKTSKRSEGKGPMPKLGLKERPAKIHLTLRDSKLWRPKSTEPVLQYSS